MTTRREFDEDGNRKCARCGFFKHPQEEFNSNDDSYCKECRRTYGREYNAQRSLEDPRYLYDKAKKARDAYRNDATARVARLEASRKWRTKQRAAQKKKSKSVKEKWEDLLE